MRVEDAVGLGGALARLHAQEQQRATAPYAFGVPVRVLLGHAGVDHGANKPASHGAGAGAY